MVGGEHTVMRRLNGSSHGLERRLTSTHWWARELKAATSSRLHLAFVVSYNRNRPSNVSQKSCAHILALSLISQRALAKALPSCFFVPCCRKQLRVGKRNKHRSLSTLSNLALRCPGHGLGSAPGAQGDYSLLHLSQQHQPKELLWKLAFPACFTLDSSPGVSFSAILLLL